MSCHACGAPTFDLRRHHWEDCPWLGAASSFKLHRSGPLKITIRDEVTIQRINEEAPMACRICYERPAWARLPAIYAQHRFYPGRASGWIGACRPCLETSTERLQAILDGAAT